MLLRALTFLVLILCSTALGFEPIRWVAADSAAPEPASHSQDAAFRPRLEGFSPFGVDDPLAVGSVDASTERPRLADVYQTLSELGDQFLRAQEQGQTRALVLHLTSPRPYQTVSLGGYLHRP